jgi:hypothetical protein
MPVRWLNNLSIGLKIYTAVAMAALAAATIRLVG